MTRMAAVMLVISLFIAHGRALGETPASMSTTLGVAPTITGSEAAKYAPGSVDDGVFPAQAGGRCSCEVETGRFFCPGKSGYYPYNADCEEKEEARDACEATCDGYLCAVEKYCRPG